MSNRKTEISDTEKIKALKAEIVNLEDLVQRLRVVEWNYNKLMKTIRSKCTCGVVK